MHSHPSKNSSRHSFPASSSSRRSSQRAGSRAPSSHGAPNSHGALPCSPAPSTPSSSLDSPRQQQGARLLSSPWPAPPSGEQQAPPSAPLPAPWARVPLLQPTISSSTRRASLRSDSAQGAAASPAPPLSHGRAAALLAPSHGASTSLRALCPSSSPGRATTQSSGSSFLGRRPEIPAELAPFFSSLAEGSPCC